MNRLQFPAWSVPVALFLACLLSFGLLIPWLGFFWDDWPSIWFLHFLGPSGFIEVFAADRPLLGRLFLGTTSILGESAFGWQVFGFMTRWFSSLLFWWLLRLFWPSRPQQAAWIALLFALYPGFSQQFIAVTYSHVFIIFSTFILSLVTMILALRKQGWFWLLYILSILLAAYSMFSVEYFFGLELLRPLILWVELSDIEKKGKRLGRVLVYWSPYALLMSFFLVWRIILVETPRGEVSIFDRLQNSPLAELVALGTTILRDTIEVSFSAWAQPLNFFNLREFGLLPTLLYLLIVAVAAGIFIIYLLRYQENGDGTGRSTPDEHKRWSWFAIIIGLAGLLVAGWPFWATGLPIGLDFPWDRFTLAMMIGTSLLVGGLVVLLTRSRTQSAILIGILVGLAVGLHFQNANHFRREWDSQKAFFWQLAWRAPGIEPGTLLLTSELPFTHFTDNSLTAPLNWTYSPDELGVPMPYLLYQIESRHGAALESFEPGQPIEQEYRATFFDGSTDQALVLYYKPPGCVQVLDHTIHSRLPQKPKYISDAMPLSDLNLINPNADPAAQPPLHILGPEPERDWCYYFEKADLARQVGDWDLVIELGEKAFGLNQTLYPVNAPEFLPYIESHTRTGNWEEAVDLTRDAFNLNGKMDRVLCAAWVRIIDSTSADGEGAAALAQIQKMLNCKE